jgi:hypothetical protein
MSRVILIVLSAAVVVAGAAPAGAQTRGRASIGVNHTWVRPHHDDVSPTSGFGPTVRLNPGRGFGIAGALDWFDADLQDEIGHVGTMRVRPVMVGVGYGIPTGRLHTALTLVAGPSFNRLRVARAGDEAEIETSLAVRPGASLTYTIASRLALTGFAGYLINRPEILYRSGGIEVRDRWRADATIISTGLVISLF